MLYIIYLSFSFCIDFVTYPSLDGAGAVDKLEKLFGPGQFGKVVNVVWLVLDQSACSAVQIWQTPTVKPAVDRSSGGKMLDWGMGMRLKKNVDMFQVMRIDML